MRTTLGFTSDRGAMRMPLTVYRPLICLAELYGWKPSEREEPVEEEQIPVFAGKDVKDLADALRKALADLPSEAAHPTLYPGCHVERYPSCDPEKDRATCRFDMFQGDGREILERVIELCTDGGEIWTEVH